MQLTGKITRENQAELAKAEVSARQRKLPRTWIVTADEHSAKIFRKTGEHLECLGEAVPTVTESRLTNKSVGRVFGSGAQSLHHKYVPPEGVSRRQSLLFARELAQWLDSAVNDDLFDRLVLAAPPRALGTLRKALPLPVRARLVAELNKDLTKFPEDHLLRELARFLF